MERSLGECSLQSDMTAGVAIVTGLLTHQTVKEAELMGCWSQPVPAWLRAPTLADSVAEGLSCVPGIPRSPFLWYLGALTAGNLPGKGSANVV